MIPRLVASSVYADSGGWGHMTGWGWGWMTVGWLSMIVLIALLVWLFQKAPVARDRGASTDALAILASRFARGEISQDEYEERRLVLDR